LILKQEIQMNKNILIPRNLEERDKKLKQMNYKLLQQEIIEGSLDINESFEFDFNVNVKTKQINGNVKINLNYFPEWLTNIVINGDLLCNANTLENLNNCPKIVNGNFWCFSSKIPFTEKEIRNVCYVKSNVYVSAYF